MQELYNELMQTKDNLYNEYIDKLPISVELKHELHNDLKEDFLMLWGFADKMPVAFEGFDGGYDGMKRQILEKFMFKISKIKEQIVTEAKERLDELHRMKIDNQEGFLPLNEDEPSKSVLDLKVVKPILTKKGLENIDKIIPALQKINILNDKTPMRDGRYGLQRKINAFIDVAMEPKIKFIDENKELVISTLCLFLGINKVKNQGYDTPEYKKEIREIREILQ
jgi:hypothetical protein